MDTSQTELIRDVCTNNFNNNHSAYMFLSTARRECEASIYNNPIQCEFVPYNPLHLDELRGCALSTFQREFEFVKKSGVWRSYTSDLNVFGRLSDKRCYIWLQPLEWRLKGIAPAVVDYLVTEILRDVADRTRFCTEFFVSQPQFTEIEREYKLKFRGKTRNVSRKEFYATDGQVIRKGTTLLKLVAQMDFSMVSNIIKGIQMVLRGLHAMGGESTAPTPEISSYLDFARLLVDALAVFQKGADFYSITSLLLSLYSVANNVSKWVAQSFDALVFSALTMCLPRSLFEIVKRMGVLTNAKLLDDSTLFTSMFSSVLEFVKGCLSYLPEKLSAPLVKYLDLLPIGEHYRLLTQCEKLVAQRAKDRAVLNDSVFRADVKNLGALYRHPMLLEWERRSNRVKKSLEDFARLLRSVLCHEATRRVEPVCFVFEGPPGVFKSVIMNQVIQALGRTTYCHSVKATKDGKDFYDMYDNEDVFFTDDIGQQGISQYRNIINWVSEVKYPLDCAAAELKDTKFFNSPIIMLTTNIFSKLQNVTKDDCISDVGALWRRGYVFDFSAITRDGDRLSGDVQFKYYNPHTKQWIQEFPCDLGLPSKVSLDSERVHYLSWFYAVINKLEALRKANQQSNDLSDSELLSIRAQSDFYDCVSNVGVVTVDYLRLASEIAGSFLTDIWDFMTFDRTTCIVTLCFLFVLFSIIYGLYKWATKPAVLRLDAQFNFSHLDQYCESKKSAESFGTVVDAIQRAMFYCVVHTDEHEHKSIALVSGHCVILPYHTSENAVTVTLVRRGCGTRIWDHMPVDVVYANSKEDVTVLRCGPRIATPFKNIAHLISTSRKSNVIVTPVGPLSLATSILPTLDFSYTAVTGYENVVSKADSVQYEYEAAGLCGSLVCDQKLGAVGMHVAGLSGSLGSAILWSVATVNALKSVLEQDNKYVITPNISDRQKAESAAYLDAILYATVPTKSKLAPTAAHGSMPVSRFPVNLSAHGHKTVKECAKKAFKAVQYVNSEELDFAECYMETVVKKYEPLPMQEVILGNSTLARLNPKSSNGFGMLPGKEHYIDYENGSLTALGQQEYDRVWSSIVSGNIDYKDFVWVECVKDELRAPHKIDTPRTFRCSTVIMQVISKRVFGNMVTQIMEDRWRNGVMVGINPLKDFGTMFEVLSRYKIKFAGDFKFWDGGMLTQFQHMVGRVIASRCADNECKIVAEFIMQNLAHSIVLVLDDVLQTTHSMPSGFYLTAIMNSLVNRAMTASAYAQYCFRNARPVRLLEFVTQVADFTYGDDKVTGSNLEGFDMLFLAQYFTELGIGFTTAKKQVPTAPGENWDDITFLKRSFVFDPRFGKIVCPLDLDTVYSSMSWYDVSKDHDIVLNGKLDAFQRELFLHPCYRSDMVRVEQSLRDRGVKHVFRSDEELTAAVAVSEEGYCDSFSMLYV